VWHGDTFHGSEVSHFGLLGLVWHSLLNGYPSISHEPLLCADLYNSWYENNASYFFFFNVKLVGISCLIHRISTLSSSTRIIGAPVSHVLSTQLQCEEPEVVDMHTKAENED
jgi:hypothetical protein